MTVTLEGTAKEASEGLRGELRQWVRPDEIGDISTLAAPAAVQAVTRAQASNAAPGPASGQQHDLAVRLVRLPWRSQQPA